MKHATRGTYTLHSLYLLLWANFGAFCIALLTQPEAEASIHGLIISKRLPVRHYCVSQLRTVWMHMRNNLHLTDEEQSFLIMCCTNRLYKVLYTCISWKVYYYEQYGVSLFFSQLVCDSLVHNTSNIIPGCLRGTFRTRQELDSYEKMWHTYIYQPSWSELKEKVSMQCIYAISKIDYEYLYTMLRNGFYLFSLPSILNSG